MTRRRGSPVRVGALVLGAVVVLAVGIFLIGDQNRLFTAKNEYSMTVGSVNGLNEGNPVRLAGVTVGVVESIHMPRAADEKELTIRLSIEARYEERIRADSLARIRTLGLLGDKYVEVTTGSPQQPMIEPGGHIPTAAATDVDKLVASGEDIMDNVAAISHSLRNVLERVDRGEGLVGELTTEKGERLTDELYATLTSLQHAASSLEHGDGVLPRLLHDGEMAERLSGAVERLEGVLASVEQGDGLVPALLSDVEMKGEFTATLGELRAAAGDVKEFTARLEEGDGLVARLVADPELGEQVSRDLERVVGNLREVAEKLNQGGGSVSRFINDPQIYDAVQDIVVGVNESRMLRWLIRNRQEKGIEKRYEDAVEGLDAAPADEPAPAPSDGFEPGVPAAPEPAAPGEDRGPAMR